jgi:hypothetical protein
VNLHAISPTPSEEEATAIMVAIDALWPKPETPQGLAQSNTSWRFSGRWWNDSGVIRRSRPRR